MASLVELTAQLIAAQAATTPMTPDEMLENLSRVHKRLSQLERGEEIATAEQQDQPVAHQMTVKEAFKKNEVVCMICGKGGFKTLTRHLATGHGLKPGEYRRQFGIPAKQSLSAKAYSESRRRMAVDRGLADNLAKARAVRMEKLEPKDTPAPGRGKTAGTAKAKAPKSPAPAKASSEVKSPRQTKKTQPKVG